jgi:hypothetical protein
MRVRREAGPLIGKGPTSHAQEASQEVAPGRHDHNDRASQGLPWPLRPFFFFFLFFFFFFIYFY